MKIEWKTCFKVGVSALILYLCIKYSGTVADFIGLIFGAAAPIFVGVSIAYVLNILMSSYEKLYFPKSKKPAVQKTRRPMSLVFAILTLIAIITAIVWLVVPEFVNCVKFIVSEVPTVINMVLTSDFVKNTLPPDTLSKLINTDWQSYIMGFSGELLSGLGKTADFVQSALTSVMSGIVSAFIGIIFAVYLLLQKDSLKYHSKRVLGTYLPEKALNKVTYILSTLNDCFRKYIVGQCTEAVILGALCSLGMLIFRFPYAGMVGAFIAFTALIPIAGAYIGAGVGAIMILTESPIKALLFLVYIIVLQQLEGNIIYPKVVGKSIGLPAMWVLAAITVGGGLMGILGMLLGVPVTSALYRFLKDDVLRREAEASSACPAEASDSE